MTDRRKNRRAWTERDDQVMRFLAQQWCADLTAIQLALNVGRARAYGLVGEWRREFRMINCENFRPDGWQGESFTVTWLRPSKVPPFLGWKPTRDWKADRDNIVHKIQVSRVRAALCGLDADRWVPERQLWRAAMLSAGVRPVTPRTVRPMTLGRSPVIGGRLAMGRRSVHDGRFRDGNQWWSVEVELTLKKPTARLQRSVLSAWKTRAEGDGLLYIYDTDRVGNALDRTITGLIDAGSLPQQPKILLRELGGVIERRTITMPKAAS